MTAGDLEEACRRVAAEIRTAISATGDLAEREALRRRALAAHEAYRTLRAFAEGKWRRDGEGRVGVFVRREDGTYCNLAMPPNVVIRAAGLPALGRTSDLSPRMQEKSGSGMNVAEFMNSATSQREKNP